MISVFVPGFIDQGVLRQFVPLRQNRQLELILLSFLTATAFNYAICSPLIYLLITGGFSADHPVITALLWFLIIFIIPVLLGVIRALTLQNEWLGWVYGVLRLRPINPIPTGWDWIFSRTEPCFVLVTLKSGVTIAGFFGERSMASSDPDSLDIFIENTYKINEQGDWIAIKGSEVIYISSSEISFIEFRK